MLVGTWPASADAHGVEVPPQLPAPQWMFGWGAAIALVASFVALWAGWTRPRLERLAAGRRLRVPSPVAFAVRGVLHVLGLSIFGLTLWAGFTGSSFAEVNLAPPMVFAGFWVVVPILSLLVGDVWRALSPWRTVALLGEAARARSAPRGPAAGPLRAGVPTPGPPSAAPGLADPPSATPRLADPAAVPAGAPTAQAGLPSAAHAPAATGVDPRGRVLVVASGARGGDRSTTTSARTAGPDGTPEPWGTSAILASETPAADPSSARPSAAHLTAPDASSGEPGAGMPVAASSGPGPSAVQPSAVERLAAGCAVAAVAGFGWLELAAPDRDDPVLLATVAAVYATLMVLGAAVFGRRFLDRADGFGRLFGLFAALAPVEWLRDGVRLRAPGVGVARIAPGRTVAGLVIVAIGVATFDGLSATTLWARDDAVGGRLQHAMSGLGLAPSWANAAAATVGLLACVGLVAVLVRLGTGRLREADGVRSGPGGGLGAFAPTLVPIAAAYLVAHYVGLFLVQGQALAVRLSDPRGDGADLLGTAGWRIDLQPLSPEALWYVQVGALVLGHVAALAAAHDLALRSSPSSAAAARSQVPMLAAMVALTALGLRLVSGSVLR